MSESLISGLILAGVFGLLWFLYRWRYKTYKPTKEELVELLTAIYENRLYPGALVRFEGVRYADDPRLEKIREEFYKIMSDKTSIKTSIDGTFSMHLLAVDKPIPLSNSGKAKVQKLLRKLCGDQILPLADV